jgi:hypothetical protein
MRRYAEQVYFVLFLLLTISFSNAQFTPEWTSGPLGTGWASAFDVTGDLVPEIVFYHYSSQTDSISIYEHSPEGFSLKKRFRAQPYEVVTILRIGKFDSAHDYELAVLKWNYMADTSGKIYVYSIPDFTLLYSSQEFQNLSYVVSADVDNDGYDEFIVTTQDPASGNATVTVYSASSGVVEGEAGDRSNSFKIYPNPFGAAVFINGVPQSIPARVTIIDATGRVVRSQLLEGSRSELRLDDLPSGVYLFKIKGQKQKLIHLK